jgi:hypothetical protein
MVCTWRHLVNKFSILLWQARVDREIERYVREREDRYITSRSNMSMSADVHPWEAISLLTAPPPTTSGVKSY